eukprot:GHVR01105340.1.p1 GENE.GHVR01105340.1~~GHVR01105340.1.p1  ORF type:complete len:190 (+),score=7.00 GHVR01105340.1:823-1392(+)
MLVRILGKLGAYPKVVDFLKHSLNMKVKLKKNYTVSLSDNIFHVKELQEQNEIDIFTELSQCKKCIIGADFYATVLTYITSELSKEEEILHSQTELSDVKTIKIKERRYIVLYKRLILKMNNVFFVVKNSIKNIICYNKNLNDFIVFVMQNIKYFFLELHKINKVLCIPEPLRRTSNFYICPRARLHIF